MRDDTHCTFVVFNNSFGTISIVTLDEFQLWLYEVRYYSYFYIFEVIG